MATSTIPVVDIRRSTLLLGVGPPGTGEDAAVTMIAGVGLVGQSELLLILKIGRSSGSRSDWTDLVALDVSVPVVAEAKAKN